MKMTETSTNNNQVNAGTHRKELSEKLTCTPGKLKRSVEKLSKVFTKNGVIIDNSLQHSLIIRNEDLFYHYYLVECSLAMTEKLYFWICNQDEVNEIPDDPRLSTDLELFEYYINKAAVPKIIEQTNVGFDMSLEKVLLIFDQELIDYKIDNISNEIIELGTQVINSDEYLREFLKFVKTTVKYVNCIQAETNC